MKLMIDGTWRGDVAPTPELARAGVVHRGAFRGRVEASPAADFPAEAGRYHLFASYACPFAHRALIGRVLKGLEGIVGVSILDPRWNTPDGWRFGVRDGVGEDFRFLHEAYARSAPAYTGKVTVPVLWDRKTRRIVSNESRDMLAMFNRAFDGIGADATVDLAPAALMAEIDALDTRIAADLAAGVYHVASAPTQAAYDGALDAVFRLLGDLEARLADGRAFLHGGAVTTSDVLAFTPLARFDAIYNPLFRVSRRRLVDHPRLAAWARRFHDLPGIAATLRLDHVLAHYHDGDWAVANRRDIVPALPDVDFRSHSPRKD